MIWRKLTRRMRVSLLGCGRHKRFGCSISRLVFLAVVLIAVQIAIVSYQVVFWSKIRCDSPMECSKVIFFEPWESRKSNSLHLEAKSARFQELIQNQIGLKDDIKGEQEVVLDCGIKGRNDRNQNPNGSLNLHVWYGWCGYTTDDLRRDPNFPERPHTRTTLSEFKINRTFYSSWRGKRVFGYIHPPKTGNYKFFISSRDSSDLWLSTDDTPNNTRMIAYLGEASDQYGDNSNPGEYKKISSQQSQNISLIANKPYFIEMFYKKKGGEEHLQVAWTIPGSTKPEVIGSKYISRYLVESKGSATSERTKCINHGDPGLALRYNKHMLFQIADIRDDYFVTAKLLDHSEVNDVFKGCSYKPKYLPKHLKRQFQSQQIVRHSWVYPNDNTTMAKGNRDDEISIGNMIIPEKEAKSVASSFMRALKAKKGNKFQLNRIIQIEAKYDVDGGIRYLVELDLKQKGKGDATVRLSEYLYTSTGNVSSFCQPRGYQWKNGATIYMIVTVMNYGYWMKDLVKQLSRFYREGIDRNFYLIVVDFNSTDINIKNVLEKSDLKDRYQILWKPSPFWKTNGLNEAVELIKDSNSIVFTLDLHLHLPANIFDAIRKHTIQGKTVYTPKLIKLKCGYSKNYGQGGWDTFGYGLFGAYKSDWDRIGGMDEETFRHKWGGEDVDLVDRALIGQLDIERICLPKFYHMYHARDQDWYEDARL
ncbi:N-acetyl-beta-glucosaminyl-glycoprotein 4-beta-N-acetylgalactosaminyltransferase 1-like [Actinia tenebrosa]|uniref:Beta-1,4-N-acetylgalactosaminyltransferase n=1 Tax=Actinia tenebrosa TaxID=6105 RepID=A0A6P8IJG7_ACTTE|nr:N-acetyl-beta-glucosaminyl-glycoprotein 4-beta-N-acetylgalactosaminyltransferase 1-like [Actinia tenebrosa]XP_031566883.1 N-acetyl-beta-glucosaminyl-glycoprotein 4-beta-N-acetylgalactosaminyltransferase 1-like [Actinia tenebrosa]